MKTGSQRDFGPLWARWIPAPLRDRYYQARADRIERRHREEFQRFYDSLADRRDVFYMFFTSGLLQWATKAVSFVPPHVNLVLLGSDLEAEEVAWVRTYLARPFHHFPLRVDDRTVWELLFATQRHNFGWLDVDCFVLRPAVFADLAAIGPQVVANTVWSFKAPGGADMLCTFCVFLNLAVLRAVVAEVAVSPDVYSHRLARRPGSPYAYNKLLTADLRRRLLRVLPEERGRPLYVNGDGYFDTLQVYQLIANSLGFKVHRVRPLALTEQLSSGEIVHIGKVSYYHRYKDRSEPRLQRLYALLSKADFVLLSTLQDELPPLYERLRRRLAADLEALGQSPDVAELRDSVCEEMRRGGAGEGVFQRILASPASGRGLVPEEAR